MKGKLDVFALEGSQQNHWEGKRGVMLAMEVLLMDQNICRSKINKSQIDIKLILIKRQVRIQPKCLIIVNWLSKVMHPYDGIFSQLYSRILRA